MPYLDNHELPERVQSNLPDEAQSVYRESYNSARLEQGAGETRSHKVAWGAVKNAGYRKREGKWSKPEEKPESE